jgi:hypothetical protein
VKQAWDRLLGSLDVRPTHPSTHLGILHAERVVFFSALALAALTLAAGAIRVLDAFDALERGGVTQLSFAIVVGVAVDAAPGGEIAPWVPLRTIAVGAAVDTEAGRDGAPRSAAARAIPVVVARHDAVVLVDPARLVRVAVRRGEALHAALVVEVAARPFVVTVLVGFAPSRRRRIVGRPVGARRVGSSVERPASFGKERELASSLASREGDGEDRGGAPEERL